MRNSTIIFFMMALAVNFIFIKAVSADDSDIVTNIEEMNRINEKTFYALPYKDGKKEVLKAPTIYERENEIYFLTKPGTNIFAAREGKVVAVFQEQKPDSRLGEMSEINLIIIDHGDKTSAFYINLLPKSVNVKIGQKVIAGQFLAKARNERFRFYVRYITKGNNSNKDVSVNLPINFKIDNKIVSLEKGKSY